MNSEIETANITVQETFVKQVKCCVSITRTY